MTLTHDQLYALLGDQCKYIDYPSTFPAIINQQVPPGFPIFLKALMFVDPGLYSLGFILYGLFGWSLWFLYKNLPFQRGFKLAVVLPLIFTPMMRLHEPFIHYLGHVCSEKLAIPLSLFAVGFMFRKSGWCGVLALLTCLIRPAFLFLPFVALILCSTRKMALASILPLVLWCGLRWIVVGDASFASYGAVQSVRIYAMLIETQDFKLLSPRFRPLARKIVDFKVKELDTWHDRGTERDYYTRWMYGDYYQGVMNDYGKRFKTPAQANAFYRGLWKEVFTLHWKKRLDMYCRGWIVSIGKFPDALFMLALIALLWAVYSFGNTQMALLTRLSGAWFFSSLGMLLLVQFPDDRYLQVCYLWLPSLLVSGIYNSIRRIHENRNSGIRAFRASDVSGVE